MSEDDKFLWTLCVWRELRSLGIPGMTAGAWVMLNRLNLKAWGPTMTDVVTAPEQFDAMVVRGDPETVLWPNSRLDPADAVAWQQARQIVSSVFTSEPQSDPTQGATNYYSKTIAPPSWAAAMTETLTVGNTVFYR
ncbi:MAG: cell wall hydrolase [Sulfobacillus sp.]